MTTDHTPPRHSSPAISAPAHRSVALTLALAALLAFSLLLPRPAAAEPLDWMPADDEIGFWGAKLPAPEGAHNWYIDFIDKDPQGHFTLFYTFIHNGREHYNYYDISRNKVIFEFSFANEEEKQENINEFNALEKTMTSATTRGYHAYYDTNMAKKIDSICHTGGYNPPIDCGFSYNINNTKYKKALLISINSGINFDCGGPCEWTAYNNCNGTVHIISGFPGISQLEDDKSIIADVQNIGLIIRFKEDMTSPFIDQRQDMAIVDFDDMIARYQRALDTVLRTHKVGNLLEETEAIVAPYFLEQIHSKGKRQ